MEALLEQVRRQLKQQFPIEKSGSDGNARVSHGETAPTETVSAAHDSEGESPEPQSAPTAPASPGAGNRPGSQERKMHTLDMAEVERLLALSMPRGSTLERQESSGGEDAVAGSESTPASRPAGVDSSVARSVCIIDEATAHRLLAQSAAGVPLPQAVDSPPTAAPSTEIRNAAPVRMEHPTPTSLPRLAGSSDEHEARGPPQQHVSHATLHAVVDRVIRAASQCHAAVLTDLTHHHKRISELEATVSRLTAERDGLLALCDAAPLDRPLPLTPTVNRATSAGGEHRLQAGHQDSFDPHAAGMDLGEMKNMLKLEMKGYKFCRSCGEENVPGARFCGACRTELPSPGEFLPEIRIDGQSEEDQQLELLAAKVNEHSEKLGVDTADSDLDLYELNRRAIVSNRVAPRAPVPREAEREQLVGPSIMGDLIGQFAFREHDYEDTRETPGGSNRSVSQQSSNTRGVKHVTIDPRVTIVPDLGNPAPPKAVESALEDGTAEMEAAASRMSSLFAAEERLGVQTVDGGVGAASVRRHPMRESPQEPQSMTSEPGRLKLRGASLLGEVFGDTRAPVLEPSVSELLAATMTGMPIAVNVERRSSFAGEQASSQKAGMSAQLAASHARHHDSDDEEVLLEEVQAAQLFQRLAGETGVQPKELFDSSDGMRSAMGGHEGETEVEVENTAGNRGGAARGGGSGDSGNQGDEVGVLDRSPESASGDASASPSSSGAPAAPAGAAQTNAASQSLDSRRPGHMPRSRSSQAIARQGYDPAKQQLLDRQTDIYRSHDAADLLATRIPKERQALLASSGPRTLEDVQAEYKWRTFMLNDSDTDSDEDLIIVEERDRNLALQCQKLRSDCKKRGMSLVSEVCKAKSKKRFWGRRRWRIYIRSYVLPGGGNTSSGKQHASETKEKPEEAEYVVVRRKEKEMRWIRSVLKKMYPDATLPVVPTPAASDTEAAVVAFEEWIQQLSALRGPKSALHHSCRPWLMFLVSSEKELDRFAESLSKLQPDIKSITDSGPSSAPPSPDAKYSSSRRSRRKNRRRRSRDPSVPAELHEASRRLAKALRRHRNCVRDVFGAFYGTLDGLVDHTPVARAMAQRSFQRDQDAVSRSLATLSEAASESGSGIDPHYHIKAERVGREQVRCEHRLQRQWQRIQKVLKRTPVADSEADFRQSARLRPAREHAEAKEETNRRRRKSSAAVAASLEFVSDELAELFSISAMPDDPAPAPHDEVKTDREQRQLVARLVPSHLIAGVSVPKNHNRKQVEVFDLRVGDVLSVGRESTSDVEIKDAEASRKHGRIEVTLDGTIHFIDVGSANGTEVDGIRIWQNGRMVLHSGVKLRIGNTEFHVVSSQEQVQPKENSQNDDDCGAGGDNDDSESKVACDDPDPEIAVTSHSEMKSQSQDVRRGSDFDEVDHLLQDLGERPGSAAIAAGHYRNMSVKSCDEVVEF